ncbi:MAG: FAD-dependent oxidoreductase, partial [Chloroflexota bacterium]|nr:FAD-dependent oxidoreductase [Chloroflexota bacterium]
MIRFQPVRPGANRSLWWEEALDSEPDAERAQPLAGSQRAEVCIIGGGYTGLWTALRIKELDPTVDVAVLEADLCGSGASGRNGGFTLSWWPK